MFQRIRIRPPKSTRAPNGTETFTGQREQSERGSHMRPFPPPLTAPKTFGPVRNAVLLPNSRASAVEIGERVSVSRSQFLGPAYRCVAITLRRLPIYAKRVLGMRNNNNNGNINNNDNSSGGSRETMDPARARARYGVRADEKRSLPTVAEQRFRPVARDLIVGYGFFETRFGPDGANGRRLKSGATRIPTTSRRL